MRSITESQLANAIETKLAEQGGEWLYGASWKAKSIFDFIEQTEGLQIEATLESTFDYQAEAQKTKSVKFYGELVSCAYFVEVLSNCITSLQELDKIKKALFYGKKTNELMVPGESTMNYLSHASTTQSFIDIMHGIIGKATEAGELLEALMTVTTTEFGLDPVNIIEEIGDGFWYDAILLNALNSSFEKAQHINIDKLRKRFPEKFTEFDANNRNLDEERKILEKGVDKA